MQILKFTGSLLVIIFMLSQHCFGQKKYLPTAVRFGTDLGGAAQTLFNGDKTKFEFNADIDFHKYFIALDYGISEIMLEEARFIYTNDGNYFRVGADVNFLAEDTDHNVLFFGLRYARGSFDDQLSFHLNDDHHGPVDITSSNKGLTARWFEIVTGMKIQVWKGLFIGYTFRVKFENKVKGAGNLSPFEVPGYGEAEDDTRVGFNYQVFWRLPFKK